MAKRSYTDEELLFKAKESESDMCLESAGLLSNFENLISSS